MSAINVLEVKSLHASIGGSRILRGVNLTIHAGEMIGLVGPSGAGKTTLINLVCRFHDVSEGTVLIDGAGGSGSTDTMPRTLVASSFCSSGLIGGRLTRESGASSSWVTA